MGTTSSEVMHTGAGGGDHSRVLHFSLEILLSTCWKTQNKQGMSSIRKCCFPGTWCVFTFGHPVYFNTHLHKLKKGSSKAMRSTYLQVLYLWTWIQQPILDSNQWWCLSRLNVSRQKRVICSIWGVERFSRRQWKAREVWWLNKNTH